jgi:adenylyltransferase/sulfurtransferase
MKQDPTYIRYQRQTILPGWGDVAQHKLLSASVLVIGAGGLGCPVLQYLAAAGVGCIGIADGDLVSLTNLHRQVLFGMEDIGKPKASTAALKLKALNPNIGYKVFDEDITSENAINMMRGFHLVVDGSDNFATRYLVNDACVLLQIPLVFGAISQFEGQVAVFNVPSVEEGHCIQYRDMFPQPPAAGEVLNCAEAGVIGVLPGIIGSLMANEAIKLLSGVGKSLSGSLLTYHALTNQMNTWQLHKRSDSDALVPKTVSDFQNTNYQWLCGIRENVLELDKEQVEEKINKESIQLIDVRGLQEYPELPHWDHIKIPMEDIFSGVELPRSDAFIFVCQSGKRSLQVATWYLEKYKGQTKAFSLKGGIASLI